jgi:hypothetical protein
VQRRVRVVRRATLAPQVERGNVAQFPRDAGCERRPAL